MTPSDAARDGDVVVVESRARARRARRPPRREIPSFSCARCGIIGRPPGRPSPFSLRGTYDAALDGNLDELQHLYDVHASAYEEQATWEAARQGRVDILAWVFCRVGPINGFDHALAIAEREGHAAATELLQFIKANKHGRRRAMTRAEHFARTGGRDARALVEAMGRIWRRLYGSSERESRDARRVMRYINEDDYGAVMDEDAPTRAQELARKLLRTIDAEKAALTSGAYVELCDALREVHDLRVAREPSSSLFDGVVFGPNRLEFDDWLYEDHR